MRWPFALALWLGLSLLMLVGNTAGYHRLLSHRSFACGRWLRRLLTLASALHSGSPLLWVGVHRMHHAFSDQAADPHRPQLGFWSAHCGWLCFGIRRPLPCLAFALSGFGLQAIYLVHDLRRLVGRLQPSWRGWTRDLMKDPLMRLLDLPLVIPALFGLQLLLAWWVGQGWGLLWLWSLHVVQNNASWVINSVCHDPACGQQASGDYDHSRDVAALAWLTLGDSFHGQHHLHPSSAKHALAGGTDPAWWLICLLHRIGWVSQVKLPRGHALPDWARPTARRR